MFYEFWYFFIYGNKHQHFCCFLNTLLHTHTQTHRPTHFDGSPPGTGSLARITLNEWRGRKHEKQSKIIYLHKWNVAYLWKFKFAHSNKTVYFSFNSLLSPISPYTLSAVISHLLGLRRFPAFISSIIINLLLASFFISFYEITQHKFSLFFHALKTALNFFFFSSSCCLDEVERRKKNRVR